MILPLYKSKMIGLFENLQHLSIIFIKKDPALAVNVIETLLRYWPLTNVKKEALFLNFLADTLELVAKMEDIEHLIPRLIKRIAKTMQCDHL